MHAQSIETSKPRLVEVRLYGHLRARFGRSYRFAVRDPAEAVRALCSQVKGFKRYVSLEHAQPGYRIFRGSEVITDGERELRYPAGDLIRIVPAIAGSGRAGQIFLGGALIVASFFLPVAPLIGTLTLSGLALNMGITLVLGGIGQLIAGDPKPASPAERPDNQPSYAFDGAVNTTAQGNPVPILFGRARVGSQVISSGLSSAALA